jgi:hypothetical protein
MHNQDLFVGIVAIGLGLAAVYGAADQRRLLQVSKLAQSVQQLGGHWAVVGVYGAVGLFLIGVGISLIL